MNDTLKAASRIGAELGAVMAECEKLRAALKRILERCETLIGDEADMKVASLEVLAYIAKDALSQQADPAETTEAYTARDMATAAAQGFRDGQKAEPAPAQDEREAPLVVGVRISSDGFGSYIADSTMGIGAIHPGDVREPLMTVAQHERIVASLARPAQTEQQPEQSGLVEALRSEALKLCDAVENINDLPPIKYALQAGYAVNKVRDAVAALSAQRGDA